MVLLDPPAPPPDPEKLAERRVTWRSAFVGAGAGVLAALIGLGGVWYGAHMSISAETERSQQEFLRTQRLTVYATFQSDADKLERLVNQRVDSTEDLAALRDADTTLSRDVAALQLVATREVQSRAQSVYLDLTLLATDRAAKYCLSRPDLVQTVALCQHLPSPLIDNADEEVRARQRLSRDLESFQEAARADLGAND